MFLRSPVWSLVSFSQLRLVENRRLYTLKYIMGNQVKQFGKFEGLNGNFKAVKTFHKLYVFINFPLKTNGAFSKM